MTFYISQEGAINIAREFKDVTEFQDQLTKTTYEL